MDSLVAAYLFGWLAVSVYVAWLGHQQRSLARRLDEMQSSLEVAHDVSHYHSKAA